MRGRCRLAQPNGHAPSPARFARDPRVMPEGRLSPARGRGEKSSCAQTNKFVLATLSCARALLHHHASKNLRPQEGASAERRMPTIAAAQASMRIWPLVCVRAAARSFGARSPSGALLRHSRGRTHPPLAQLQFPRFLRPDQRALPHGPVTSLPNSSETGRMPVERWPGAARDQSKLPNYVSRS